jgi:hypothetical protein
VRDGVLLDEQGSMVLALAVSHKLKKPLRRGFSVFLAERGGFELSSQNFLTLLGILKVLHANVEYCCVELGHDSIRTMPIKTIMLIHEHRCRLVQSAARDQCLTLTRPSSNRPRDYGSPSADLTRPQTKIKKSS